VPVAVALTRKISGKEQKVIILGDADFMSNAEVTRYTPNNVNSNFVIRVFKWFSDGEYPVSAKKEDPIDTKITVTRSQINWQKGFFLGFFPLALTLVGGIILIRRKRN
ncbi:MAG: ABC transporter permease, partial [Ginsengibacter sp.]